LWIIKKSSQFYFPFIYEMNTWTYYLTLIIFLLLLLLFYLNKKEYFMFICCKKKHFSLMINMYDNKREEEKQSWNYTSSHLNNFSFFFFFFSLPDAVISFQCIHIGLLSGKSICFECYVFRGRTSYCLLICTSMVDESSPNFRRLISKELKYDHANI
jgi:hypothetical protein